MDGRPDRWLLIESIFDLVSHHACLLQQSDPAAFEVEKETCASFPTIRLLTATAGEQLILSTMTSISRGRLPLLPLENLPDRIKRAVLNFIQDKDPSDEECKAIQKHFSYDESYLKKVLVVRGMISGGILHHVLSAKRWSVNYGLHPPRCLCAVPYRAKGVPAPTAEFGHPGTFDAGSRE